MSDRLRSYVNGAWRDGARLGARTDPAHPSIVVAETSLAGRTLAVEAITSARAAFPSWRAAMAPSRGEILRRAADILERHAEEIGRDLTREEGKTIGEAVGETRRAVAILRYYAGQTLEPDGETYPSQTPGMVLFARREPLGVVTAITPWNFPIAIPAWKIAPALAYGNTVVWKPAELVPLTAVHFASALIEAGLPAGVLNLVLGRSADVGEVLVTHPDVDAITFTGSNAVGRALQAMAPTKKVQLEMGGKNPAVVLADADLDFAAEQVARGAFLSAGEKCTATSRVIVERSVLAGLAERLAGRARDWKVGDPLLPNTQVGPLVSDERLRSVLAYVEAARADGGRLLAGGERDAAAGDGYFLRPTVFSEVPASSRASREEIFGPVALVSAVDSYADALAMANDTPFGLTASLFTRDLGRALAFAREARAGVVKVNQETAGLELQAPFGGTKDSSSGSREQGKVARDFFTEWKTVYLGPPG